MIAKEDDGQSLALAADVSDAEDIEVAVDLAPGVRRIDILYNNAGVNSSGIGRGGRGGRLGPLLRVTSRAPSCAHERRCGTWARAARSSTRARCRHGRVPNFAAYCAAKGAVVALTRSDGARPGGRADPGQVICPGTVYTR